MIQANQKSSPLTTTSANCAALGKKDHHRIAGTVHQQNQLLSHQNQNVGPQKRKASSGMNCRKRSAEPRPHPPHLLNKRYWDELKAGRAKQPQAGIEAANELPKKAKLEPIVVKQQPPRAFGLANANKRSQPDLSPPKQANSERMVISRPSANSQASVQSPTIRILSGGAAAACSPPQQQWNAVGGAGSSIRLSFPPPPPSQLPAFPPNLGPAFLASTLPLGPPPNGFPMLPPHSLSSSRFLSPFIPPQLFSTAPQSQLAPPPFPLQFTPPFNGQQLQQQQQQHMAFGNALALFTEILRKQQSEGEATGQEMAEENGTSQTHPSGELELEEEEDSDEQIDRMLDALVMERQGQAVQQQPQGSGTLPAGERLCILPLPILVPIPMPLSIDFVLKHFSGTGIPGKSGVKRTA